MNIVLLDAYSLGDIDLSAFEKLGEWTPYTHTKPEQVVERCQHADVIITNKVKLMRAEIEALPMLKLICIAATGMNNVDLDVAKEKGVEVKNVADYSTDSVAQHTFSLLLSLMHQTQRNDHYVKSGAYGNSGLFTYHAQSFFEIKDKKWGIIGMGSIGKRVAAIAQSFGAELSYYSTSGKNLNAGYPHKGLDDLLTESDVITIHSPLNDQTLHLLDYQKLCLMKPSAYLINVGRGGILREGDLAQALRENRLAGAGLDVYEQEPLNAGSPLLSKDIQYKLLASPHIAWSSKEARQRLVNTMVKHIASLQT